MNETPSQIRNGGSNGGTIWAVETLATAGTVPGRDRTVKEFDMHQRTNETPAVARVRVRKVATWWQIECPCGYRWDTHHHRLAIMFATEHAHWTTGPACLDHAISGSRGCPCGACPCNVQDGQCRYCRRQVA